MHYTDAQLEAIKHINGNLQIIACAGSGKTQTISARIANMVLSGIPKEQILAFTFTEKAANVMKLRIRSQLEEAMPDDPELGSMYIGTIHSFCLRYLKEIKPEFRNYDIIDENKQLLFLSRHGYDIGINQLSKRREPPFNPLTRFVRTVDIIKQNQIPETQIYKDAPDFYNCYLKYYERMSDHKFIDFATIVDKLVNILESEPLELTNIREKIKYVVVDEYQDINPIQEKLINLIAGENGNLCIVGDDDQSIFEFQGANVENILTFSTRYKDVKEINLLKNFRSTDAIIESARDLIQYNKNNRLEKKMEHGQGYKKGEKGDIYQLEFETRKEEVEFITQKIKELRGYKYLESIDGLTNEKTYRGLDWCDFAVLVRTNATAKEFVEVFEKGNIPFTTKGTAGLFKRHEIRFLQMVFNYLCDTKIWSPDGYIPCTISDLKAYYAQNIDLGFWEQIESVLKNIKIEINEGNRFYPQEIYHRILQSMGMDKDLFNEGKLYDFGRFSQLILDFETVNEWVNIGRLKSFVFFLNGYAEAKIDVGGLDDPTQLNTVSIQTIHKAKGLEYPVVFIPDLATRRFPSQRRTRKPDVYLNNLDLTRFTSGDYGERRLFYVGVTRTEKFLFMTMAKNIGQKITYRYSTYYDEYTHDLLLNNNIPDPTDRSYTKPTSKTILETIPTTFTDLQYFIKCPYDYLLRKLMGFSPTIDLSFGYGLQIHNLLNRLHKENPINAPSEKEVDTLTESEFFLRYTRGPIFDNMKGKTKEILKNYISSYGDDFPLQLETEKPFEFILDEALISGQIDLITKNDPNTNEVLDVNLIDFKTEKRSGRRERDPINRLQLRLYSIAAGKALGLNPIQSNIHYLSDDVRISVDISQEKLEGAKEDINKAVQGIKKRCFDRTPGKYCEECDFSKICSKKD
ncbi:ATP-dependent DNA helicase [Thermodesulfobacteriota bacterium]